MGLNADSLIYAAREWAALGRAPRRQPHDPAGTTASRQRYVAGATHRAPGLTANWLKKAKDAKRRREASSRAPGRRAEARCAVSYDGSSGRR